MQTHSFLSIKVNCNRFCEIFSYNVVLLLHLILMPTKIFGILSPITQFRQIKREKRKTTSVPQNDPYNGTVTNATNGKNSTKNKQAPIHMVCLQNGELKMARPCQSFGSHTLEICYIIRINHAKLIHFILSQYSFTWALNIASMRFPRH